MGRRIFNPTVIHAAHAKNSIRLAVMVTLMCLSGAAAGQNLQNFTPSAGTNGVLVNPGALTTQRNYLSSRLIISAAKSPLTQQSSDGRETAVIEQQLGFDAMLAWGTMDMLEVGLAVPFGYVSGDTLASIGEDGLGLGDIRFSTKVHLNGDIEDKYALGADLTMSAPTGRTRTFYGSNGFTFHPRFLVDTYLDEAKFHVSTGFMFRPETEVFENIELSHEMTYGAGFSIQLDWLAFELIGEVFGALPLTHVRDDEVAYPLEGLLGLQYVGRQGLHAMVGSAFGLHDGRGVPSRRLLFSIGYRTRLPDTSAAPSAPRPAPMPNARSAPEPEPASAQEAIQETDPASTSPTTASSPTEPGETGEVPKAKSESAPGTNTVRTAAAEQAALSQSKAPSTSMAPPDPASPPQTEAATPSDSRPKPQPDALESEGTSPSTAEPETEPSAIEAAAPTGDQAEQATGQPSTDGSAPDLTETPLAATPAPTVNAEPAPADRGSATPSDPSAAPGARPFVSALEGSEDRPATGAAATAKSIDGESAQAPESPPADAVSADVNATPSVEAGPARSPAPAAIPAATTEETSTVNAEPVAAPVDGESVETPETPPASEVSEEADANPSVEAEPALGLAPATTPVATTEEAATTNADGVAVPTDGERAQPPESLPTGEVSNDTDAPPTGEAEPSLGLAPAATPVATTEETATVDAEPRATPNRGESAEVPEPPTSDADPNDGDAPPAVEAEPAGTADVAEPSETPTPAPVPVEAKSDPTGEATPEVAGVEGEEASPETRAAEAEQDGSPEPTSAIHAQAGPNAAAGLDADTASATGHRVPMKASAKNEDVPETDTTHEGGTAGAAVTAESDDSPADETAVPPRDVSEAMTTRAPDNQPAVVTTDAAVISRRETIIPLRQPITFASGEMTVDAKFDNELRRIARLINADKTPRVVLVEGHSSPQGKPKTNVLLSSRRAQEVRNRLIQFGVPKQRITYAGFGAKQPPADGEHPGIRGRRVVVRWVAATQAPYRIRKVTSQAKANALVLTFRTSRHIDQEQIEFSLDEPEVLMIRLRGAQLYRTWIELDDPMIKKALLHPSTEVPPSGILRIRMVNPVTDEQLKEITGTTDGRRVEVRIPRQ
ncbi:MAG: OmpA family protein [Myxococcota bacterium]|nr:OmpA family protein [Myxococcota bacterium]